MNERKNVERAVVAAILGAKNGDAKPYLRALFPEHFEEPEYRSIFEAARALSEAGDAPTPANVSHLGKVSGVTLGDLEELALSRSGFDSPGILSRRLIELHVLGEIQRLGAAASDGADVFDLIEKMEVLSVCVGRAVSGISRRSKDEQVDAVHRYFQDKAAGRIKLISTGLESLDRALRGGLSDSGLSYLVAPGGFGKTSLALTFAVHAARSGFSTLYLQGEMTEGQMHRRGTLITQGADPESDSGAWGRWADEYQRIPLRIETMTDRTPTRVLAECERAADEDVKLVCLDYLQVFSELPSERFTDSSREFLAIRHLSRKLRQFALKSGVHVLAISARNRNEDGRRSTLSSLYGGTGLEHDATEAFILRRYADSLTEYEDQAKKKRLEEREQVEGVCLMILDIVKARDAVTGPLRFTYNKRSQQFREGWGDAGA